MREMFVIHSHEGLYLQEDGVTWGDLGRAKLYDNKVAAHKAALEGGYKEEIVSVIIRRMIQDEH